MTGNQNEFMNRCTKYLLKWTYKRSENNTSTIKQFMCFVQNFYGKINLYFKLTGMVSPLQMRTLTVT